MPLSWNEIRSRALAFSREWEGESSEDAEAKSFWDGFFNIFGVTRRRVASFETPVKKEDGRGGFIDLLWRGVLLIEHKSRGKDLDRVILRPLIISPVSRSVISPAMSLFRTSPASGSMTSTRTSPKVAPAPSLEPATLDYPWSAPTDKQHNAIESAAQAVLDGRARFPEASLADLYDPLTMPPVLLAAHQTLDRAVDAAYLSPGSKPFAAEARRVAFLFEQYRQLIE